MLNHSLKKHGSAFPLVVFATATLPQTARAVLESQGIRVRDIEYLEPQAQNKGELNEHDLRFDDTWTKLRCFEMVEYEVRWLSSVGFADGIPSARRHGELLSKGNLLC